MPTHAGLALGLQPRPSGRSLQLTPISMAARTRIVSGSILDHCLWTHLADGFTRCLGVDQQRLHRLPGVQSRRGCDWRVQREVHGEPNNPSWRFGGDSTESHSPNLSKLLSSQQQVAIYGIPPNAGRPVNSNNNETYIELRGTTN
jgi:hypothetical protein